MHKSRLLSLFTSLILATSTLSVLPSSTAYAINSTGKIESTDGSGNDVIIDADDIRTNYAAIRRLQTQMEGLGGRVLEWSDDMATYVIRSYETDENGDILYDDEGKPRIAQEEAIGALGTADPTMVVENRSFSSLYSKGLYTSSASAKGPGVQQNGTLVDVLNNGFTENQMKGQPFYATSDTVGTGSSSRAKQSDLQAGDETTADLSNRLHSVSALGVTPTESESGTDAATAIPNSTIAVRNGAWTSKTDDGYELDHEHTSLLVDAGDALTLPAGYYDHAITINNGVINKSGSILASSKIGANPVNSATNAANIISYAENEDGSFGYYSSIKADGSMTLTEEASDVMLGLQETFTLPAGYYSGALTISNGVRNNGYMQDYFDENDTSKIPAAYYAESDLGESAKYQQLVGRLKNLFGDAWTGGDDPTLNDMINALKEENDPSFIPVTELQKGEDVFPTGNEVLSDNLQITADPSVFSVGINESVVVPGGYHPQAIKIKNGVHNNGTVEQYLDDHNTNTVPAAYYTDSDLTQSVKYQTLVEDLKTLFGDVWTAGDTPTLAAMTEVIENNSISMSRITSVNADRYDNPSANTFLTGTSALTARQDLNLTPGETSVFELGANEKLTIPAGYYANDITIKNGIINRGNGTQIVSSSNTLEPGYYEGGTIMTANPSALSGDVDFYHHVHDLNETDKRIMTSTAAKTTEGYADNYESPIPTGCFTQVVYKQHLHKDGSGNVVASTTNRTKGGCFQSMRYTAHSHIGSSSSYGGCYKSPVYNVHNHTGSSTSGTGCYTAFDKYTTHTHTGSSSSGGGCYGTVEYYYSVTTKKKVTCNGKIETENYHENGVDYGTYDICQSCGHRWGAGTGPSRCTQDVTKKVTETGWTTDSGHAGLTGEKKYSLNCNNLPLNATPVYKTACGMTEGSRYASEGVDYYTTNCGGSPLNTSPTYDVTCGKTHGSRYQDEGIDFYARSCGRLQGEVVKAEIRYQPEP